ncbi:Soluble epoxide hydrolase [Thalassocella blandensis]|nr:Soluble epoxide hydrolase [Thalassocella blandensis]
MPTVNVNGIDIHTQVLGEKGPLIFMCHGLVSGSVATWYFKFAPELAKNYRVVLYDMRGHGKSEKTATGFDLDTMANDLACLITHYQREYQLENKPYSIVGHSFGALVALHYSLALRLQRDEAATNTSLKNNHPYSLVIIDAPLPASTFIYPSMKEILNPQSVESLTQLLMLQLNMQGERRRKNLQSQLEYLYLESSLKQDIAATKDVSDEDLASLTMPVKLIYGKDSDCYHIGERLAGLLPKAKLKTLNCGHYIPIEQPDQLAVELNEFFDIR